jgi:type VI secretion system secreted protein Hcp
MNNAQRFKTLLVPAVACLAMAAPAEATAAMDIFLQLDGIKGESVTIKFEDQMEVFSWSFGLSRTVSGAGTGAARSGKLCASDISVMKQFDKSSPQIMTNMVSGKVIPKGKMSFVKLNGDLPLPYLVIELNNVLISSYQVSGSSDERPIDSVSLHFSTAKLTYTQTNPDGSPGAQTISTISGDGC